jgi:hypothetical protein
LKTDPIPILEGILKKVAQQPAEPQKKSCFELKKPISSLKGK